MNLEIWQALQDALHTGEPVALVTVIEAEGSAPTDTGAKILVRESGETVGTVGGGTLELRAVEDALSALREGRSRTHHYVLREEGEDSVGMLCGGEISVFIEAYRPQPTLLLVGGGHVGRHLAEMAERVGFRVQIVDIDPERRSLEALEEASISTSTYVVIMTSEVGADEDALREVVEKPAAYIGMIGSRRKVAVIFQHLQEAGISQETLARVRAPIGLDLGGRTPAEIALAVLAEMVTVRYGKSGQPLSARD